MSSLDGGRDVDTAGGVVDEVGGGDGRIVDADGGGRGSRCRPWWWWWPHH